MNDLFTTPTVSSRTARSREIRPAPPSAQGPYAMPGHNPFAMQSPRAERRAAQRTNRLLGAQGDSDLPTGGRRSGRFSLARALDLLRGTG